MLFGDVVHDLARSRLMRADAESIPGLRAVVADLHDEAEALLARDGIPESDRAHPVTLDFRYPGQAYEIGVSLPPGTAMPEALDQAVAAFHDAHERQYAHAERHVRKQALRAVRRHRLDGPHVLP